MSVRGGWRNDPRAVRTFRYALGATLAMALSMGIDWQLAYLTPVLTINLLGSGGPRPSLKFLATVPVVIGLVALAGVVISASLLSYPVVFLIIDGLAIYLLYYAAARGAPQLLVALVLIGLTVIPVVSLLSPGLAVAVAGGLFLGTVGAVFTVWVAHFLIRDPPGGGPAQAGGRASGSPELTPEEAATWAGVTTLVIYPAVCFFYLTGSTAVIVLVFIAMLSVRLDPASGARAGKALVIGNAMGGLLSIVMYELLVIMPQYGFMLLLTLLGALYFGGRTFSGARTGPLWTMAFQTAILIVASTTSLYGDANAKAFTRVLQIGVAVGYVTLAFTVIPHLMRRKALSNAPA